MICCNECTTSCPGCLVCEAYINEAELLDTDADEIVGMYIPESIDFTLDEVVF